MGVKTIVTEKVASGAGSYSPSISSASAGSTSSMPSAQPNTSSIGGTVVHNGGPVGGYSGGSTKTAGVSDPNPNGGGGGGSGGGGGGGSGGGGGYGGIWGSPYGNGMIGAGATQTEPAEPVDTSYLKTDLYNSEQNVEAYKEMLKAAGYDTNMPPKALNIPGQVALPNKIDLPNVNLPNAVALPNDIDLGQAIDFQKAMQQAGVKIGRVDNVDTHPEEEMLQQLTDQQREQAILNADRTVETGTADLQRQMQNAQDMFRTQQEQIDINEQRAKDNQALYAEARGDRGGIGAAQYDTIQNTAATNRLTVQQEQTQLATDTARQIADLRSQGEFEKANQLLSISQNHLAKLMELYHWAKEANIGIDEFNLNVAQWEESYKLNLLDAQLGVQNSNLNLAQAKVAQAQQQWANAYQQENSLYNARWNQATDLFNAAYNQENSLFDARRNVSNDYFNNQLNAANYGLNASKAALEAQLNAANATGAFGNGAPTYAAQQDVRQILAASGQALLEKGIIPTAEQLQAMGMTADQAVAFAGGTAQGMEGTWGGPGIHGGMAAESMGGTPIVTPSSANYSANKSTNATDIIPGTPRIMSQLNNAASATVPTTAPDALDIMSRLNRTAPATAQGTSSILSQLNQAASQSTPGSATRFYQLNNTYSEPNVTGVQGGRIVRNR